MSNSSLIIIIVILCLIVGLFYGRIKDKQKKDIIKLLFKRDLLPSAAEGTNWTQGGICYMGDGGIGKVNGRYCEQIIVL